MASSSLMLARNFIFYKIFCSFHGMSKDQDIVRSEEIAPSLIKAIRESEISIVILSKKLASSSLCLDELVEILESIKTMRRVVMTVFYGVDPSDVRKQIGKFGVKFTETCAGRTHEEIQKWREALTGEDSLYWEDEAKKIEKIAKKNEKIAKDFVDELNEKVPIDFDDMVGLKAHLKEIESLLDLDNDKVKMVGIIGPVNEIDKTTIGRALNDPVEDALKIFYRYAFRQSSPPHGFGDLVKSVIEVYNKVPVDLRMMGSLLRGKKEAKWEDEVRTRKVYLSGLRRRKMSKALEDEGNIGLAGEDLLRGSDHLEISHASSISPSLAIIPKLSSFSNDKEMHVIDNMPLRDKENQRQRASRTKVIIEWSLVITNFILEIPSCVLDQISSTHRPSYALAAMLLSLLACLICLIDLLYKGIDEKVVWKWTWPIPWFYYPTRRSNRFGSFPEMVGMLCGVCQTILTAINFSFIIHKVDAPIKVSAWAIIFALGMLITMYLKKNKTS